MPSKSKASKKGGFRRFLKMLFGCCIPTESEPSACEEQRPRGPREMSQEKAGARAAEMEQLRQDARVCEVSRRPKDIRPPKTVRFDAKAPTIIPAPETPPCDPNSPDCMRPVPRETLGKEVRRSSRSSSDSSGNVFVNAAEYLNRDGYRVFPLVKPTYRSYSTPKPKGNATRHG